MFLDKRRDANKSIICEIAIKSFYNQITSKSTLKCVDGHRTMCCSLLLFSNNNMASSHQLCGADMTYHSSVYVKGDFLRDKKKRLAFMANITVKNTISTCKYNILMLLWCYS